MERTNDRVSVAVLSNAPAPYRTPFFNDLSKGCRLLVSFDTMRESYREWALDDREFGFEWVLTRGLSIPRIRSRRDPRHLPLNIMSVLERFQPDVVISSELGVRTASAALFCRLRKRPLVIWWEGTPHIDGDSSVTAARRRMLLRHATRAWGNGQESAMSLQAYGVSSSRIDLGMTGVDTFRWKLEVETARASERSALREQHKLHGTVVLFVGRLTSPKGIPELLAALSILASRRDLPPWSALFVGSGPLAREIGAWAETHPRVPVALAGFVQPHEMAKYYAAADLFTLPTLIDRWSLVCLDALVAGLPQVTSLLNGGAADLVTSDEVGTIVDPRDVGTLARHLGDRIRAGPLRVPEELRDRTASEWSVAAMVQRAMSSVRLAAEGRSHLL